MRDDEGTIARRPRPVADAPIAPYARGTGLAKAWLLELITRLPLDAAGRVPADRLATEAPALCAAICAALVDDGALTRLEPGGVDHDLTVRARTMTGAQDPAGLVASIEALRRVTWHALRGELREPEPDLIEALTDRLAYVCAVVAAGALKASPLQAPERDLSGAAAEPVFPDDLVTLHDTRPNAVPAWRSTLERRLAAHRHDGRPFAVLLVEIDDFDRVRAAHDADELGAAVQGLERAATAQLRPGDVLVPDSPGRYWVTLGDSDSAAARVVATELASAATSGSTPLRGAALRVSVGIASSPQDGSDVQELLDQAEAGVFRARAAGVPVSG
jgi:GGDEF domain-containing protein